MGDLNNLNKLLTNLNPVLENAILFEKERFRHQSMAKAQNVEYVAQFIGAFHDGIYVYPTKISATKVLKGPEESTLKLTISLNKIQMNSMFKDSPDTELHPFGEGPFDWDSVLKISITDFVKYLNATDSIMIKNIPNQMLSEKQIGIKELVLFTDQQKESAAITKQLHKNSEKTVIENSYSYPIT